MLVECLICSHGRVQSSSCAVVVTSALTLTNFEPAAGYCGSPGSGAGVQVLVSIAGCLAAAVDVVCAMD